MMKELSISPQWKEIFFLLLQDPLCSISILIPQFETIYFEPLYSRFEVECSRILFNYFKHLPS